MFYKNSKIYLTPYMYMPFWRQFASSLLYKSMLNCRNLFVIDILKDSQKITDLNHL